MAQPGAGPGGSDATNGSLAGVRRWAVRAALAACGSVVLAISALFLLDAAFPPPLDGARSTSSLVLDRNRRPIAAFAADEGRWRFPVDLDRVDPAFVQALIAIEDKRFYQHGGVDTTALVRAATSSLSAGRIVSGGSTITMQTARLLEPRKRTFRAKMIEMFRAWQIERRLSKREILEMYLQLAPYGGNLEGIRAASWAYFGREPDRLSDDQMALLITLPQSPEVRRPDLRPEGARLGRDRVLAKMQRTGILPPGRIEETRAAPLPDRRAFPATAWHASRRVVRETEAGATVTSSIDLSLQLELERLVAERARALPDDVQIAGIVVHVPTRGVRAMVGAAIRERPGGWIDLTTRARSPGSTLKPFIYAMAFDDGFATPDTRISDLPSRFDGYRPENFDRSFNGDVRISDALAHSLNVPAVLALDRIGPERFAAALGFAGIKTRVEGQAEARAGLALALGGAGVTLEELAMLYAGLADDGVVKPLAWTLEQEAARQDETGVALISADSARSILDILRKAPTPAGRVPGRLTKNAPDIAFKTGTSYGFRDAWAAGVAGEYAFVVWVGRPDGAPRPGQTGRAAALPILFEVADRTYWRLDATERSDPRIATRDLRPALGALTRFSDAEAPPQILFPPPKSELWGGPDAMGRPRQFVLAGRGQSDLAWYINGEPSGLDDAGAAVWSPSRDGFYRVTAVDAAGRSADVQVRVIGMSETMN